VFDKRSLWKRLKIENNMTDAGGDHTPVQPPTIVRTEKGGGRQRSAISIRIK